MRTCVFTVTRPSKSARGKFDEEVLPVLRNQGADSVEVTTDESNLPTYLWTRYRLRRRLQQVLSRYERVFLPSQDLLYADPQKYDPEIIVYVHDVLPATTTFSTVVGNTLGRIYVRNVARADEIICASEATARDLFQRTSCLTEPSVVYQGVSALDVGSTSRDYDLVYVGSLIERKDPEFIRRSIQATINAGYRCVAVNFQEIDLPCRTEIGVSERELAQILSRSRYYLHPSRVEGFGRGPVEAQVYGCIPLGRDTPINHEILGPVGESWAQVSSPEDVVATLSQEPSESSRVAARENASGFDWDITRQEIAAHVMEFNENR